MAGVPVGLTALGALLVAALFGVFGTGAQMTCWCRSTGKSIRRTRPDVTMAILSWQMVG